MRIRRATRGVGLLPVLLTLLLVLAAGCTIQPVEEQEGAGGAPAEEGAGEAPAEQDAGTQETAAPGDAGPGGLAAVPDVVRNVEPSVVAVLREQGEGSGVIYDADGLIVTNNHVVEGAANLEVQVATGERLPAEVVAADPATDLAVLEIDQDGLPAADFADELPEVGALAIAIGNPVGLESTVTVGVISGLGRSVPSGPVTPVPLIDLIQTDAAISPGNSGGALVSARGEVVGINIAYVPPQAGAVSIGFAVPSSTVQDVVGELLETGQVERGFLGVSVATLTPQIAERFQLGVDQGVLVTTVAEGSPASEVLSEGDVVTALDGETLIESADLYEALRSSEPGQEIMLTVVSDGEEEEVEVTLVDRPAGPGALPGTPEQSPGEPEIPPQTP